MADEFNPDLLRVARQARGMSQAELSTTAQVSQAAISKLENGLVDVPSVELLEKLAAALKFPRSLFFEPDRVYGLPISVHSMYRKKASVGERALHQLEAEINLRLLHFRRLLKSAVIEPELSRPHMDPDEYAGGPEQVAALVRRTWLVQAGPVKNLTELVERSGCIVVHCDFSAIGVDGVTLQAPGLPPTIFLNRDQPADRMRFTLAHELGHIIMHKVPSPTMDDEADAFASAFLMPAGDVRPYLTGGLGLARLASLKPIWRVSMAALLYRAKAIGAISSNQSSYLWRQLSAQGYRRREPVELEFARELPTSLPEIIRVHMEDLGYDLGDLSRLLHVETDEISRFQPIKVSAVGQTLRVIK